MYFKITKKKLIVGSLSLVLLVGVSTGLILLNKQNPDTKAQVAGSQSEQIQSDNINTTDAQPQVTQSDADSHSLQAATSTDTQTATKTPAKTATPSQQQSPIPSPVPAPPSPKPKLTCVGPANVYVKVGGAPSAPYTFKSSDGSNVQWSSFYGVAYTNTVVDQKFMNSRQYWWVFPHASSPYPPELSQITVKVQAAPDIPAIASATTLTLRMFDSTRNLEAECQATLHITD